MHWRHISLAMACEWLNDASAIIVNGNFLTYCNADYQKNDENEFMYLALSDDRGFIYEYSFIEERNLFVKIQENNMMILRSHHNGNSEDVELQLLGTKNIFQKACNELDL